ncbi:MAG TPA: hypothetical protein VKD26_00405 [Streptosporangiaceae bacterium]|nr:hypothetical protein [Streptosporangiaceae bacterium]
MTARSAGVGRQAIRPAVPARQTVVRALRAAVAAPSMHNTQPWRLRYREPDQTIEMYADPARTLRHADPDGRGVHIACGAAVFNLRLAIAVSAREPVIRLLPNADEPLLLATVRIAGRYRARESERELFSVAGDRHTHRKFGYRHVPASVLAELVEAAMLEGAALRPLRDLAPGGPAGRARPARPRASTRFAVLCTSFGGQADWLRAGQALQRVLLLGTARGLTVGPLTLAPRTPGGSLVRDPGARMEHPQMVLRLGYGPADRAAPRGPFPAVLDGPEFTDPARHSGPAGPAAFAGSVEPAWLAELAGQNRTGGPAG